MWLVTEVRVTPGLSVAFCFRTFLTRLCHHSVSNTHIHTHPHTLPAGIPYLEGHQAPVISITPISAEGGGGAKPGALIEHSEEDSVGLSFQLASLDRCGRGGANGRGK